MARIKIAGLWDEPTADLFGSCMIDIAYVDEVRPDAIYLIADIGVDFEQAEDFVWITGVIKSAFAECKMKSTEISLEV